MNRKSPEKTLIESLRMADATRYPITLSPEDCERVLRLIIASARVVVVGQSTPDALVGNVVTTAVGQLRNALEEVRK